MKENKLTNHEVKPALCLDLDGTVRRTKSGKPFIESIDDIELMPGIEKIIKRYKDMGYLIFGISNQGGVAHGFKLPQQVVEELNVTISLFKDNPFHIIKCCYHDEKGKVHPYNHRSLMRKPDIGSLVLCEYEAYNNGFVVDWNKSIFVGDRPEDKQCAENAKIKFHHIDEFLNMPHTFIID